MYKNECRIVRLRIEEADLAEELNSESVEHLRGCRSCREFYESEAKLRLLVAGLPQVEAPADFDFRLRARIANDRAPSSFSLRNFGVPSLAAAALILLVAGFLFVRNVTTSPEAPANVVASGKSSTTKSEVPSSTDPGPVIPGKIASATSPNSVDTGTAHKRGENKQLLAVGRGRTFARDSSSLGATVVRQNTSIAGVQLPLIFPVQTLSVSLDDGSGIARTISFPTVSFGSERVLTRAGNSFQGSVKGDW